MPGTAVGFDFTTGEQKAAGSQRNHIPYLGAGGHLAVVPQKAASPEAAFALAAELCGRDTGGQIFIEPAHWGSGPLRISQLDDVRLWGAYCLDDTRSTALRDAF